MIDIKQKNMKLLKWTVYLMFIAFSIPAHAQDEEADNESKYGETPEQRQACMEALTIYRGFRDQDNIHEAYIHWQTACKVCPPDASERVYSDGAKFLKSAIKEANKLKNTEKMKVLIDSLFLVYDTRLVHFSNIPKNPDNGCAIKGLMAADMYALQKKTRLKEAHDLYKVSVDCLKEKSLAGVLSGYYIAMYDLFKASEGEEKKFYQEALLTEYLSVQEYAETALKTATKESAIENYAKAKNNIDEIFILISNCEEMVPVLENKLKANPNDFELKKKVLRLLNKKDCSENAIYLSVAEAVHASEPSSPSAYAIGQGYAKKNELGKSLKYFEEAFDLCGDCSDKENYALKAGQVASALKMTSKARSYANKVLEINGGSGEAYLLIGDVIASSSAQCEDGKLGARSVYWLAADYYAKAKRADPSVADKADRKIASAASQFPSREDLFQYGIKEGDSFTTCFGESTIVRERK